jgi:SsrA-binding protein
VGKRRRKKRRTESEPDGSARSRERTIAVNRRARYNYEVLDQLDAGLVLTGSEIKSIRNGAVSLAQGYVAVEGGEAFLLDLHIGRYKPAALYNHEPRRPRKLLLHRDEIAVLQRHVQTRGLTAVPLRLYLSNGWAKVQVGLVRGRRSYDKRDKIREREDAREIARHVG